MSAGRAGKHANPRMLVTAPQIELEAWSRLARSRGMTRAEWLRSLANREVTRARRKKIV